MPARDLIIGLDASTTACKAVLLDAQGQTLAAASALLPMRKPRPAWHEQPAQTWWSAACQALRQVAAQVDPARLGGLSIAAQRETFVVTGAQAEPLADALLWMDERCRELLPEINRRLDGQRIHQETGKPLSANLSLGKLIWLKEFQPDLFARIARVLDVHAFLAYHLTGRFATSWGCADPMGLFDMPRQAWDARLIEAAGLSVAQFPEALPPGALVGELTAAAARATGLPQGLPLFAGLGDGQAAGLGVCAAQPGESYLNLGTAVITGTYSPDYRVDPAFRTMFGGVPGSYLLETVLLGGTYTINWFLDNFAAPAEDPSRRIQQVEAFDAAAAQIPPGAEGLTLVPYWNSVMNPYWDASASGIVVGWRGVHTPAHLFRAILEGIAFELRLHVSGVEAALQQPIERFIAVGGGAHSSIWRQIIADVTGRPVYRADAPEASALGAGILAAAGLGWYPDVLSAAQAMTRIQPDPHHPDPARQVFYSRLYEEVYRHLFPALQAYLSHLADLTAQPIVQDPLS